MNLRVGSAERPVICLFGPTATGKTDVALALRAHLPVDIISVDSAMVYRRLDVGTAKPSPALRQRHPHALVDIIEPEAAFSAAAFRAAAIGLVQQSWRSGRIPLLVGGSMFWFRALLHGLSELPAADAGVRAAIDAHAARDGWPAVHARLAALDPLAAQRIHPNDPQRLQRALEIATLAGRPQTDLWQEQYLPGVAALLDAQVVQVALLPADRGALHQRIGARLELMLAAGLVDEVASLRQCAHLHADLPSMRAVGYRQIWQWLDGGGRAAQRAAAMERVLAATRQLAKRQLTWLRRWSADAQGDAGQVFLPLDPYAPQLELRTREVLVRALQML